MRSRTQILSELAYSKEILEMVRKERATMKKALLLDIRIKEHEEDIERLNAELGGNR